MTVNTDGTLDVDLDGSSDLRYVGDPELGDVEMSGGSSLERDS